MATPSLTRHHLAGALGDILIDVRTAGRGAARPAVLVVHGFKGFKDWGMFPVFADRLARAGFTAVSFNMSGSGADDAGNFTRPDHFRRATWSAELADIATVTDALVGGALGVDPPPALGAVGHSRGGGVAILHAARDPRVRALVTWAAVASVQRWSERERTDWRARGYLDVVNVRTGQVLQLGTDVLDDIERSGPALDIEAAAARIRVPWLIVHGTADEAVSVAEAGVLAAASPVPTTRLLRVEGSGHVFGGAHPWTSTSADAERVFADTLSFLATSLG
jgi:pimeloyl-ACP methyl ester carboxylesterase